MKTKALPMFALSVAGLLAFQSSALAEIFQGTVSSVDPSAGFLNMQRIDSATGSMEEMRVAIPSSADLRGLHTLADLKPGDEVKVDASKAFFFFGPWQANSLEATLLPENQGPERSAAETSAAESQAADEAQSGYLSDIGQPSGEQEQTSSGSEAL